MTTQTASFTPERTALSANLGVALLVIVLGGVLTGALFLVITYQSRLIFFSALVPAVAASMLISYVIWQARIHGRVISLVLGLLLGLLIYGSYQGFQYLAFRRLMADQVQQAYGAPALPAKIEQAVDEMLAEETGATGFLGYVRYLMQQGMVIRGTMPPMGPANEVSGSSYLLYWVYDAGLILLGALTGAWAANKRAYCTNCAHYYGRVPNNPANLGMERLGWIDRVSADEFTRSLEADHFEQAGMLLQQKRSRQASLDIRVERCEQCDQTPVLISVYKAPSRMSNQQALLSRKQLDAEAYGRLTAFAALDNRKHRISSTNEWLISGILIILFMSGLVYLLGTLQTSM